jgi:hypothetical protein
LADPTDGRRSEMRRIAMVVGLMALMVVAFAPVALAINKQCTTDPCRGTANNDQLREQQGNREADTIYGLRGNDTLRADRFTRDNDRLYGNRGRDTLNTEDGDGRDLAAGGRGNDTCYIDDGDRYRSCETLYIDGDLQ